MAAGPQGLGRFPNRKQVLTIFYSLEALNEVAEQYEFLSAAPLSIDAPARNYESEMSRQTAQLGGNAVYVIGNQGSGAPQYWPVNITEPRIPDPNRIRQQPAQPQQGGGRQRVRRVRAQAQGQNP